MNDATRAAVKGRMSYVNVFKPRAAVPGADEKFSVTVLVPKTDLAAKAALDAAINAAIEVGVSGKWNGLRPPQIPHPIHDGDGVKQDGTPFGDECKGCWVFTASANVDYPPTIVDLNRQPIIDPTQVYSGMYGVAAVRFFPYMYAGKKGIGCGLEGVMKTRDGEVLGGQRPDAETLFGSVPAAPTTAQPVQPVQPQGFYQQSQPQYSALAQPVPQGFSYPAPPTVQQPVQQPAQEQQIDPFTGLPMGSNNVMGI